MFKNLPAMGFNTWNTFGGNINEVMAREIAAKLVSDGYKDAGYEYFILDDGWQGPRVNGKLTYDEKKFPSGMKALADYVHSLGLKFGMYSSSGYLTCMGLPASYEYEFDDAETFASWDVDYLKYDYCNRPYDVASYMLYRSMGLALANCGRDILFSACSWGADGTPSWIKSTGSQMWRSTGDICDNFASVKALAMEQTKLQVTNGTGCFNDMDMLIVGMHGKGNVGVGGCTAEEYRTHFSLWAFLMSPLIIGADIRCVDAESLAILMNKDIIAINQDPECRQPFKLGGYAPFTYFNDDVFMLGRLLSGGDIAIGAFNLSDGSANVSFTLSDMGIDRASGRDVELTNLWTGEKSGMTDGIWFSKLEPHTCCMMRAKVIKK